MNKLALKLFRNTSVLLLIFWVFVSWKNHSQQQNTAILEDEDGGHGAQKRQLQQESGPVPGRVSSQVNHASQLTYADTETEREMSERVKHMKQVCHENGLDRRGDNFPYKPNPWEYIVNREYGLVWCNIFKSASSSWMYIFNRLTGYSPAQLHRSKKSPLQLARDKYGRQNISTLVQAMGDQHAISFLIGRNPMERLVSAYRDKIQGALHRSPHDLLRRNITEKYRNIKIPKSGKPARLGKLPPHLIPTFQEFCLYVIDEHSHGAEADMHWAPAFTFCTPCQLDISAILLFETLERDTEYVLRRSGVPPSIHSVRENPSLGKSFTPALTTNYTAQLSEPVLKKIIDIYRMDYLLFGYKIPKYDDYQGKKPETKP